MASDDCASTLKLAVLRTVPNTCDRHFITFQYSHREVDACNDVPLSWLASTTALHMSV